MKLTALTPVLRTWEFQKTILFYTELLGFQVDAHDETSGWASLSNDDLTIMLAAPNEHEGDIVPEFTGSLYFTTDDVDALWLQLKDKAEVCYPPENFEYGMREFAIYDNNDYLLQFGQEWPG
jgi:catechol 2,3-dioxygenase-like lactoylglutathione lyase family enzyme